MKIAAVLLAGGEGRRIGGAKPLRMFGDRRLIDHALDHARRWGDIVAVAVRGADQLEGIDVPLLVDDPALQGPLAGLVSALNFARVERCQAVLTLPCDMPFLPADLRARLATAGAPAAIAASGGRCHPVCGLWRVTTLADLPMYAASGRRSLRGFAETTGFVAVEWSGPDPFFNINTSDDLQAAEARLGG
jgi:molybdenum cofactor guanylyltransferase